MCLVVLILKLGNIVRLQYCVVPENSHTHITDSDGKLAIPLPRTNYYKNSFG